MSRKYFLPVSLLLLVMLIVSLSLKAWGQKEPAPTYQSLLAQVKNSDPSVDFKALRLLYAETADYNPYKHSEAENDMFNAYKSKEYEKALKNAQLVLDKNYVNIDAHNISKLCYKILGKVKESGHHDFVVRGLIKSILSSGDGKSPQTAYQVITTTEEYVVLGVLGFKSKKQSLLKEDGHNYDKMEVTNPDTGEAAAIYFNVDLPFGWLKKNLK